MSDVSRLAAVVARTVTNWCWGAIDQSWESTSIRSKSVYISIQDDRLGLLLGGHPIDHRALTDLAQPVSYTSCFMVSARPSIPAAVSSPARRALMPLRVDPRSKNEQSYHQQASTKQIDSTDKQIHQAVQAPAVTWRTATEIMWSTARVIDSG